MITAQVTGLHRVLSELVLEGCVRAEITVRTSTTCVCLPLFPDPQLSAWAWGTPDILAEWMSEEGRDEREISVFRISKIQLDEAKYLHAGLTGEAGHLAGDRIMEWHLDLSSVGLWVAERLIIVLL